MTRRARWRGPVRPATAALSALLLLGGCAGGPDPEEAPDRDRAVAHDLALLHALARQVQERPGVVCVAAELVDAGGVPGVSLGDVRVLAVTEVLPVAGREALVRDVAQQVWDAGLTAVLSLGVSVGTADADASTSSDIGRLLGGPDAGQVATSSQLEAAFGPLPSPAATVPPDPGPQTC